MLRLLSFSFVVDDDAVVFVALELVVVRFAWEVCLDILIKVFANSSMYDLAGSSFLLGSVFCFLFVLLLGKVKCSKKS